MINNENYDIKKDWCCFISQTGTEVVDLCFVLKQKPTFVVTNNKGKIHWKNTALLDAMKIPVITIDKNTTSEEYIFLMSKFPDIKLITLHGFLRILPPDFIKYFEKKHKGIIVNGHPAYISKYPELKGKDPQFKVIDKIKYPEIGHTIHKVIEEVDAGEILLENVSVNDCNTIDEIFSKLQILGLNNWENFFKNLNKN